MFENSMYYSIFCGVGGINSVLLGVYLLRFIKQNKEYLFFSIFLISTAASLLSKGLFYFTSDDPNLFYEIIKYTLWFISYTIKGPCIYFYSLFLFARKKFKFFDLIHFIIFITGFILFVLFRDMVSQYLIPYSTLQFFIYLILSILIVAIRIYKMNNNNTLVIILKRLKKVLIIYLLVSILIIALWYIYRISLDAVLIMVLSYTLIYMEVKNNFFSNPCYKTIKYKFINLSSEEIENHLVKINNIISTHKLYLDKEFTLNKLSQRTNIKPYIISVVINQSTGTNFCDFINTFRIKAAIDMIEDPRYENLKLEYISYNCGFSSLSSFNKFFKRITGSTPSEYKAKTNLSKGKEIFA